jgi:hypothetical protein
MGMIGDKRNSMMARIDGFILAKASKTVNTSEVSP